MCLVALSGSPPHKDPNLWAVVDSRGMEWNICRLDLNHHFPVALLARSTGRFDEVRQLIIGNLNGDILNLEAANHCILI